MGKYKCEIKESRKRVFKLLDKRMKEQSIGTMLKKYGGKK